MKKTLVILAMMLFAFGTKAQDPFVTQKFNNPVFTNPALAGNGTKLNRLSFFYRDQWRSVPVKYVSTFFNYDRKLWQKNNNKLGGGIQFVYDKAGDGSLSTFNPNLSFSYTRYFNEKKQAISAGFNIGYVQRTIDMTQLQFDNQFNGIEYDPNLATGENLSSSTGTVNMGIGMNFMTLMGKFSTLDVGFVVINPHQPDDSFSEFQQANDDSGDRPIRFNTYLTTELFLTEKWSLTPSFYFQGQEKAKEFHSSMFASFYTRSDKTPIKFSFGGGYRNDDAAFAYTGLKIKDVQLGLSYDINTSDFQDATNKKGGFEMSLVYEFERKKKPPIAPEIVVDTIWITMIDSNELEIEEEVVIEEPVVEVPKEVELIKKELPLKIFFDNDHPNPNTYDSRTTIKYSDSYEAYVAQRNIFEKQIGKEAADQWFETIAASKEEFDTLGIYVKRLLDDGYDIKLTIKGYSSPLANDQYNTLLSMRRIESVVLELKAMENNMLLPYFENGRIQIIENPFGETYAPATVDDNANNRKKSVYSPEASFERRVEVIAIEAKK